MLRRVTVRIAIGVVALALASWTTACSRGVTSTGGGSAARGPQNGPMDVHRAVPGATSVAAAGSSSPSGEADEGVGPKGPPSAVVPDVEGLAFGAAVQRLWRSGLDVQLVLARSSDRPLYDVIEQDPGAGTFTPASGEVNLVLSLHREGGAGVLGTVACKPEMEELDPYCLGKLLKY